MGTLIYTGVTSLDGYINDARGHFDWAKPSDEVHAFVNDTSPQAYEHLVDGLLAKPSFGEERARYWLGDRRSDAMELGHGARQLFSNAGKPADCCSHYQSKFVADSAAAREPWPD